MKIVSREEIHLATVTLRFELKAGLYLYNSSQKKQLNLAAVAEDLYDIKHVLLGPLVDMAIRYVAPIGIERLSAKIPQWLVIEITEAESVRSGDDWQKFVVEITAQAIEALTPKYSKGHTATIEIPGRKRLLVTDEE